MARSKLKVNEAVARVLAKRPWDADDARVVLDVFSQSGLSQAAFSKKYGFSSERLSWWRKKLFDQNSRPEFTPELLPVRVVDTSPVPTVSSRPDSRLCKDSGVEVMVGGGRRVRLTPGFDAETLYRAVEVLEVVPC
jgi:hypothetical protein